MLYKPTSKYMKVSSIKLRLTVQFIINTYVSYPDESLIDVAHIENALNGVPVLDTPTDILGVTCYDYSSCSKVSDTLYSR